MIKSTNNSTFPEAAHLIGKKVWTGSPGYEMPEVIMHVRETNAYGKDGLRIRIEFDSDFSTNMSLEDFEHFLKQGEAVFVRWFGSRHDRAAETIAMA